MSNKDWNISNTQQLTINHASLKEIPLAWTNLDRLESLDLSYNQLQVLRKEIGNLQQLKKLDLSNNKLNKLPESLSELKQLEFLNLSNNKLESIPLVVSQLPALKVLRIKGNALSFVPDDIRFLQQLEYLDISFNPIKDLPTSIGQLKNLRRLNCTSNQFNSFPYPLLHLEKLEYLQELDLHFRLKINTSDLVILYKVLRLLRKRKANFDQKIAAFQIFVYHQYDGDIKNVFPLLRINYKQFSKAIRHFLIARSSLKIGPDTSIAVVGKTEWINHKTLPTNDQIAFKIEDHTSHILAGQQLSKKETEQLKPTHQFLDETLLMASLYPDQDVAWLTPLRNQLIDLLMSPQNENIALALKMSEDNPIQASLLTELLWAYTHIDAGNKTLRSTIKAIFYRRIPDFDSNDLPSANFKFFTPNKSEHQINKDIVRVCKPHKAWEGGKIARYLYQKTGTAYQYILSNSSPSQQKEWLSQFIQGQSICLSPLKSLSFLPKSIVCFPAIETIDLKFCSFKQLPDNKLLVQMQNLHTLDLRNNPISSIPRKEFKAASAFRIYISKY